MHQENWEKVKEIFHQALTLEPPERETFLKKACAVDNNLRQQVETLLESYESGFLEESALPDVTELLVKNRLSAGHQLGKYKIKELIGTGGMGEVFLAEDTELKRPVALKVLRPEVAEDKERISRFVQEARAASALNHYNILTIYEIGLFEGIRFIASEYVKGETLREKLKQGNLQLSESLEIVSQIATALNEAHEAGIIHRDIKPENIIIKQNGLIKVLDFGLAKLTEVKAETSDSENSTLAQVRTSPGLVMGTVAYMSPEQARGQEVDQRTDIWSLGVVLYEMLSGKLPFSGETTSDIIASILKSEAEPFEKLNKEIPVEIERICFKALAKNANNRYQTAQEFLQDIKKAKKYLENEFYSDEQRTDLIRHRPTSSAEYLVSRVNQHKVGFSVLLGILVLTLSVGIGSYWFLSKKNQTDQIDKPETPLQKMKISRLTTTGEEVENAISPDGKYVAHINKSGYGKQSIIIRQTATSSSNTIVNSVENTIYWGLAFSPDGDFLYYAVSVLNKENNTVSSNAFRIPVLGGTPMPIINDGFPAYLSFSPDGNKIAYFNEKNSSEGRKLQFASQDEILKGKAEPKTLTIIGSPEIPEKFTSWSPDGSTIACIISNADSSKESYRVVGFNVATGERKDLTKQNWKWITSLAWNKITGDLFITGNQTSRYQPAQIWRIDKEGIEHRITNDLNNYEKISLSADGSTITVIQNIHRAHIYTAEAEGNKQKISFSSDKFKQITQGVDVNNGMGGVRWTPDGRLTYQAVTSEAQPLFIMNGDGSNIRQLTFDNSILPGNYVVTPDGNYIVFCNFGHGGRLWRLNLADNSLKQLTFDGQSDGDGFSTVIPDGKNIIYEFRNGTKDGLRQISIEGGEPIEIFENITAYTPSISPDGKYLAVYAGNNPALFSMSNKNAPPKIFSNIQGGTWFDFGWTPNSSTLLYLDPQNRYRNIQAVPINGGQPYEVTNFPDQQVFSFDLSRDGKRLAISRGSITTDVVLIKDFN